MTTKDVYQHFGTPSNLQQHMLVVAGLICSVQEHWTGEDINWDGLIVAGLLHDLGNVVKFDLDNFPGLLGDELPRIDFWREEQKRLTSEYGNDDHIATAAMLEELNIDPDIKDTIQTKSFGNIRNTAKLNNWLPKVLQYCDLRAAPNGLMTLDERVADIKERYGKYAGRSDFPDMIEAAKAIEHEIAKSVDAKLEGIITAANAAKHQAKLLEYKIRF